MNRAATILVLGANIRSGRQTGGMLYTAAVFEQLVARAGARVEAVDLAPHTRENIARLSLP